MTSTTPASIYLFKVNKRNSGKGFEICSKLTTKTPERRHWRCSGVFIVKCEHISHIFLVFLLLNLKKKMLAGTYAITFLVPQSIQEKLTMKKNFSSLIARHLAFQETKNLLSPYVSWNKNLVYQHYQFSYYSKKVICRWWSSSEFIFTSTSKKAKKYCKFQYFIKIALDEGFWRR